MDVLREVLPDLQRQPWQEKMAGRTDILGRFAPDGRHFLIQRRYDITLRNVATGNVVLDGRTAPGTGSTAFSAICDWENLETHAGIEQKDFLKQVTKAYAYENVMAEIKKRGYTVAEETTDKQQHVHITVRKWS